MLKEPIKLKILQPHLTNLHLHCYFFAHFITDISSDMKFFQQNDQPVLKNFFRKLACEMLEPNVCMRV